MIKFLKWIFSDPYKDRRKKLKEEEYERQKLFYIEFWKNKIVN